MMILEHNNKYSVRPQWRSERGARAGAETSTKNVRVETSGAKQLKTYNKHPFYCKCQELEKKLSYRFHRAWSFQKTRYEKLFAAARDVTLRIDALVYCIANEQSEKGGVTSRQSVPARKPQTFNTPYHGNREAGQNTGPVVKNDDQKYQSSELKLASEKI